MKLFNNKIKRLLSVAVLGTAMCTMGVAAAYEPFKPADANNFYKSQALNMQKVSFKSVFDTKIAGNLYLPKQLEANKKYSAIIVGHPMGAVKEQSANLYAQKMAEKGFITLSIDLPYWGESGGSARNAVDPTLYAEAFSAAADYLGTQSFINRDKIGVIGICSSGGFAISAAKIDPRLKAVATVSMYDMGAAVRNGLRHSTTLEQRKAMTEQAAEQRYNEFLGGKKVYTSGTVHEITEKSNAIEKEFYDFYRTDRGKESITVEDLFDVPLLVSSQKTTLRNLQQSFAWPVEKLNIIGKYNLIFNAALLVEEGLGCALCLDKLVATSENSSLKFIPLTPRLEMKLDLAWRQFQPLSREAAAFLQEVELLCNQVL